MERIIKGTSCYENCESGNTLSITGDGGNAWGYFGPSYKKLAPSLKLYEYYRDNPNNLSEEALINYYIKEYFNHRLSTLNTKELLYNFKEKFGTEIILLCHELPGIIMNKKYFCHRRIVADFIELDTGIVIPELKIDKNENIKEIETFDYKKILKKYM